MRWIIIIFTLLLGISCTPSLYRLNQFEHASSLKVDTLYFVYNSNMDDILLLEKYNQQKKAEKQKEYMTENLQKYKESVSSYYDFSNYEFWDVDQHNGQLPVGYYIDEIEVDVPADEYSSDRRLVLQVKDRNRKTVIEVNADYNGTNKPYASLIKRLNKKLHTTQKESNRYQTAE